MSNKDTKDEPIKFNVENNVDELLKDLKQQDVERKEPSASRIKFAHDIRKNPPEPGYMKVEVEPKIYSIDLNTDAHWWFTRACTVFPLLLDQAKRTHIDIKDSFKAEKRRLDFQYWWVIFLAIGMIGALLLMNVIFKIF